MADTLTAASAPTEAPKRVIPREFLFSFILVTFLFSLWGFANDITNPMVAAFKNILLISNFESSLVQFAFYGGYCVMAFPAALFIKRYSYKAGILVGLSLYAAGCLLFIPSGWMMAFWAFLLSYFIMTCGLSFLETSANPYILAMGPEENSTRRLNFAQAFNPMGSIIGMFIASQVILVSLNPTTETGRRHLADVAGGKTHHEQVYSESIESIEKAKTVLQAAGSQPIDMKTLMNTRDSIQAVRKQLSYLDTEKGPQAVQLREDFQAAEKNAPGLLYQISQVFAKDPAAEEAVNALKEQNGKLKEMFNGSKSDLDITVQVYEESNAIAKTAPLVLGESRQQIASAAASLQAASDQVGSALEQLESSSSLLNPETLVSEITGLLDRSAASIREAQSQFESIPDEEKSGWYTAAGKQLHEIQQADLGVIIGPYTILGFVVIAVLIVFAVAHLPRLQGEEDKSLHLGPTLKRLFINERYIEGVVAQAFYVGAQIMCWTFIIQYAENELGMEKATAQNYNILAMAIFVSSRFICTYLLKYFRPGMLLMSLAVGGFALVFGTIFLRGMIGLYCLVGVSACMSLMFPTIYGIALRGLGDDAKLGAAGLIMAIGGGCLMPPMQGWIMDQGAVNLGFMTLSSTRASFILPLICFAVIAIYGLRSAKSKLQ